MAKKVEAKMRVNHPPETTFPKLDIKKTPSIAIKITKIRM